MTLEQIDALTGRELDAEIARRVFGWKDYPVPYNDQQRVLAPGPTAVGELLLGDHIHALVPHFSTDMGTAWQIIVWLAERGHSPVLHVTPCETAFRVVPDPEREGGCIWERVVGTPGTAGPVAVCRAALKALL